MTYLGADARVKDVLVNLVREAKRVELLTERCDEFHFGAREDLAGGIVGIAENDGAGLLIKSGSQLVSVEGPIGAAQRHIARRCVRQNRVRGVVFIKRFEDDYFVSGIDS